MLVLARLLGLVAHRQSQPVLWQQPLQQSQPATSTKLPDG
jgi:hypothetical protein